MIRFREGRCFDLEEVKSENWGTGESLGTNGRKLSKSLEKHRKIIGVSAKNRKIIHDQTNIKHISKPLVQKHMFPTIYPSFGCQKS